MWPLSQTILAKNNFYLGKNIYHFIDTSGKSRVAELKTLKLIYHSTELYTLLMGLATANSNLYSVPWQCTPLSWEPLVQVSTLQLVLLKSCLIEISVSEIMYWIFELPGFLYGSKDQRNPYKKWPGLTSIWPFFILWRL